MLTVKTFPCGHPQGEDISLTKARIANESASLSLLHKCAPAAPPLLFRDALHL